VLRFPVSRFQSPHIYFVGYRVGPYCFLFLSLQTRISRHEWQYIHWYTGNGVTKTGQARSAACLTCLTRPYFGEAHASVPQWFRLPCHSVTSYRKSCSCLSSYASRRLITHCLSEKQQCYVTRSSGVECCYAAASSWMSHEQCRWAEAATRLAQSAAECYCRSHRPVQWDWECTCMQNCRWTFSTLTVSLLREWKSYGHLNGN